MSSSSYCAHCQASVPNPRVAGWRILYWLSFGLCLFAPFLVFGVLALFAVAVLPIGVLLMGGIIAPLRERAYAEPQCQRCHRFTLPAAEARSWRPAAAREAGAAVSRQVAAA